MSDKKCGIEGCENDLPCYEILNLAKPFYEVVMASSGFDETRRRWLWMTYHMIEPRDDDEN